MVGRVVVGTSQVARVRLLACRADPHTCSALGRKIHDNTIHNCNFPFTNPHPSHLGPAHERAVVERRLLDAKAEAEADHGHAVAPGWVKLQHQVDAIGHKLEQQPRVRVEALGGNGSLQRRLFLEREGSQPA